MPRCIDCGIHRHHKNIGFMGVCLKCEKALERNRRRIRKAIKRPRRKRL